MALIRHKRSVKMVDFLGTSDECYALQGSTHKALAQKFLAEVTDLQKQCLFFYGEKGMGKTRLAKETARELAKLVNDGAEDPLMYLFFIKCERVGKHQGAGISEIKKEIAQKVAAVDETLSAALSKSETDEFSTKLSASLLKRVFLFLMDGLNPSLKDVLSFISDLVQHNENILILTTSCVQFSMPRLAPKVSTYKCTGLREEAAIALLRDVAGRAHGLSEYEQELVSCCYFNPLLIMTVGQEMNERTTTLLYTAKEIYEVFQHSFSLAVQPGIVPEKDDVLANVLGLAKTISESISKNLATFIDQPSTSFTAEDIAVDLRSPSAAVAKKSFLQELSKHNILNQNSGFFSISDIFKNYFQDHRVLLNQTRDEFVEQVYQQLKTTLKCCLSEEGVMKMLMIHRDEMDKITDLEKRIATVDQHNSTLKYAYRVQLIMACEAFLRNIPISSNKVCEFNEAVCVKLHRYRDQNQGPPAGAAEVDVRQQLMRLEITENCSKDQRGQITDRGNQKTTQRKPLSHHLDPPRVNRRDTGPTGPQKTDRRTLQPPRDENSLARRFGVEVSTSQMSTFGEYSSLTSSDAIAEKLLPTEVCEPSTIPLAERVVNCRRPPGHYPPWDPCQFCPSQPQEDSYHEDSHFSSRDEIQPTEESFHDWPSPASVNPDSWSMDVNMSSADPRGT